MKKNDHYFPTNEWVKDSTEECGWRRVTYDHGVAVEGESAEGIQSGKTFEDEGGLVADLEATKK